MFRDYEKHPYGTFEGKCQQPQQQRKSYYTMVQGNFFSYRNNSNDRQESDKKKTYSVHSTFCKTRDSHDSQV